MDMQMKFGQTPIDKINIDLRARDEIPKLLLGLQFVYCDKSLREKVFEILEKLIKPDTDKNNGRPGMELWKILVLGIIRVNCNWDYDKLHDIANNHKNIRQMLGHGLFDDDYHYPLQTLKDNISLFTPEIIEEINTVIVQAGQNLVLKKKGR